MTDLLGAAAARLVAAGVENARQDARLLLALALNVPRDETLSGALTVSPEQQARFEELVGRRAARVPMAYITGVREFWSLNFSVGPGVLVPRPDSETLIEAALAAFPDRQARLTIGDLGTGSGALLIAALTEFPHARGLGFESSPDAFAYARANAAALNPAAQIYLANWSEAPENTFDLIFCNPPYIPSLDIEGLEPEVRAHEPYAALDGGADGLDAYRALAKLLPRLLRPGGIAILELGAGQAAAMELVFSGMKIQQIVPDLAGISRALVLGPHAKEPK